MVSGFFLAVAGLGSGGDGRDRTADLLIANQSLSQLSYAPIEDGHFTRGARARQMGADQVTLGNPEEPTPRLW